MAKILILGAGVMGTAITFPLAENGHEVVLVGTHLDGDIIRSLSESQVHPKLKRPIHARVTPCAHHTLGEHIDAAEAIFLGVNSLGVTWAAETLAPVLQRPLPVVFLTKGLAGDGERISILPDVFRNHLPRAVQDHAQLAAVGGPSIAAEISQHAETCVTIASRDSALLDPLASLLRTTYLHVWTTTDLLGVELSVALKNLYAFAVGLIQGVTGGEPSRASTTHSHNPAAAVFAQGLWETAHLLELMGADLYHLFALPGAGDLFATSERGRNVQAGRLVGSGIAYPEIKRRYYPEETIEGAELAFALEGTIEAMIHDGRLDEHKSTLLRTTIGVICRQEPVSMPWESFFSGYGTTAPAA
jgi:glycerol-3-phosphate dehydrogenase (NAD(P)+)